jgi:hypothetical protein
VKAVTCEHDLRSLRGAAAGAVARGGEPAAASLPEFARSGHRELDGMIEHHAQMARRLAEQLGLPDAVLQALAGAYERRDGRGWPGALSGDDVPLASRIAQLAEFVEVAHRVGGVAAAKDLARERSGKQFDPTHAELVWADGDLILAGFEEVDTWRAVVAAEPALAVVCPVSASTRR